LEKSYWRYSILKTCLCNKIVVTCFIYRIKLLITPELDWIKSVTVFESHHAGDVFTRCLDAFEVPEAPLRGRTFFFNPSLSDISERPLENQCL